MKTTALFIALLAVICAASPVHALTDDWKTFTGGAFSFKYPPRWTVKQNESHFEISNDPKQEQILILAMPFDARKTPAQLAKEMIDRFKPGMPDITASNFQEKDGQTVYFQTAYSERGVPFRGEVLVIKDAANAFWFSYTAPSGGYDQKAALDLLIRFLSTISSGGGSKAQTPPENDVLQKNARAFLFTLEFAVGAPFTQHQESVILEKLVEGWKQDAAENLRKFDRFPQLVELILRANQQDLETLRKELENTTAEWLNESDPSDPVVRIVKAQLDARGKVLLAGEPPLTEMAAAAYTEMLAFAELLEQDSAASPSRIPKARTDALRELLLQHWNSFSVSERKNILTTPGLWITFRTLLRLGSANDREKVRSSLLKLAPSRSSAAPSARSSRPASWVNHQVLLNIQQQTFNHYMWSRGFKSTIFGY